MNWWALTSLPTVSGATIYDPRESYELMKLIKAVIRPHRLDSVHEALVDIGVTDLTASEVKSFGRQLGHAEIHRGAAYRVAFMPMVQVEVVVADSMVERVLATILEVVGTDRPGDGKVFVCDVLSAHTRETDEAAL